ncbi:NAD(P)/FAD-dependent oxidoreductase [Bradyrhizobium sp. LHD-71]|uniref:flavin monoamine oxidase family protein n=1 Tax=Bradyrhizobium sp. LHD-71 TaxID=3072141 RepID=UPI00280F4560|nr:NAD(P)/FAD-dependent oxidoreductase [Bradyrhizobium sp. LHD-71]MDQ8729651.1 NAD(P)/FAD-dependent oxidoreductase [Bradyrhizobium sp. LHD-71]
MPLSTDIDVAIIGAGAAGLGAARALEGTGLRVKVLEARDRIGGRAFTRQLENGIVFDVGCGWLHSADRNEFVRIAGELGFDLDRGRPHWTEQTFNIGFPREERLAYLKEMDAFYDRVEAAAESDPDRPASDLLKPGNRWNAMLNCISTYINGAELDRVSIRDTSAYEDTEINWRVKRGFGALVAAYGAPCPVELNAKVTLIDHSSTPIRIETSRGTLTAARVIVTVPTNLIANETVRFLPALLAKVDAATGVPLGLADKVMLALDGDGDALPRDGHLRGSTTKVGTGSYHLRPQGFASIEGFFGGRHARELEDAGEEAFAATAIDELVALLGSDYRRKLRPLSLSRWAHDPFATGSYSHALPGHADARAKLAAPIDDRIFFAGEATSPNFFSTCHGALESGMRAAAELTATPAALRGSHHQS